MAVVTLDLSGNGPSGHSPMLPVTVVEGTFTGTGNGSSFISHNNFNASLSGTWGGTVDLERSFDFGTTWVIVTSYTANTQQQVDEPEDGIHYRWNCSTHDSGTVVHRLSNSGK